ncbi:MAG: ATP-dependent DNA helicase [Polyangiaceae bacterium]|nr:ATP-dependent DNA helicase [Polyangiaceae bacterium]MCB9606419.1 ATP-dependent DNA helicase [Polyangiaceae bacterium]
MATAVERALAEDRVLLCEAGTGTGKTLAYLVPALASGRKVIISTATRALQDQIAYKDVPLVARALGVQPRVSVMKGLANYVCMRRLREFKDSAEGLRPGYALALNSLQRWVPDTETGDISELVALQESDPIWREVTSSSDTRIGVGCEHYDECFVTRMKREAESARVVIVNHHLFFADLALRGPHPGRVLPDYDAVIFDEAHQIEDIATNFFGVSVSRGRVDSLLRDAERMLVATGSELPLLARGGTGEHARRLTDRLSASSENFFSELVQRFRGEEGRTTVDPDVWRGELEQRWHSLDASLEAFSGFAEETGEQAEAGGASNWGRLADACEVLSRKGRGLREDLASVIEGGPGRVTWVDVSAKTPRLSAAPVDVAPVLKQRIFESIPAVIMTSATLASVGSSKSGKGEGDQRSPGLPELAYLRSRVGLGDDSIQVDELIVRSPFDFERMALLYTPNDLPDPRDPRFLHQVVERVHALCELTGGGAFVLTTSLRSMRTIHRGLLSRIGAGRVMLQGEAPKASLLSRFKAAKNQVLVATMSFWEGVDVPGEALRLVVLEKIPFAVPSDPIVRARSNALEAEGRNSFMELHVPGAAITLKQGFGRLIRTRTDRGIVALLDERATKKGYGSKLLSALPPARRTGDLDEVRRFWNDAAADSGA